MLICNPDPIVSNSEPFGSLCFSWTFHTAYCVILGSGAYALYGELLSGMGLFLLRWQQYITRSLSNGLKLPRDVIKRQTNWSPTSYIGIISTGNNRMKCVTLIYLHRNSLQFKWQVFSSSSMHFARVITSHISGSQFNSQYIIWATLVGLLPKRPGFCAKSLIVLIVVIIFTSRIVSR